MATICDNIYSTCNVLFINMAWFVQEIFLDLNNIGKDLKSAYYETHNKTHLVSEISVKKYESFDQYNLVYNHNLFDAKKIRFFLSKAYSKYYFRLSWLTKHFFSFV